MIKFICNEKNLIWATLVSNSNFSFLFVGEQPTTTATAPRSSSSINKVFVMLLWTVLFVSYECRTHYACFNFTFGKAWSRLLHDVGSEITDTIAQSNDLVKQKLTRFLKMYQTGYYLICEVASNSFKEITQELVGCNFFSVPFNTVTSRSW